jgi:serine/threonine protein kinase
VSITDEIALSADSLMIPVADLPGRVRDQIGDEGAFVVTRTRSRSPSVLVDRLTASLLEEFRRPSTIVAAVLRLSRQLELEPEEVLEQSFPIIRRFLAGGYLTGAAGDGEAVQRIALPLGRRIAGGTVVRCVRVLEDTELYQVLLDGGGFAALKLLKPEQSQLGAGALAREARILRRIDGRVAPRVLTEGLEGEHHWLCMEWCEGSQLSAVAAASRRLDKHGSGLLELCRAVVRAYVELHDMGLVHGDVHPGNVLASASGRVTLIDFGLARAVHEPGDPLPRGGVLGFFDPWHARALLARTRPPPPSYESDLYSLGAVVYQLLTGAPYLDLSIEKDEALRQIAEDPPLPFAHRDRPPRLA